MIFFVNEPAPSDIYTLSLHDALPIYPERQCMNHVVGMTGACFLARICACNANTRSLTGGRVEATTEALAVAEGGRSEEHTSELQSHVNLVCRLLLEKKNKELTPRTYL